ncbi:hypothetical protein [Mycobacteroides abscessus]|uniref:hypothetical protein n=1 Tax=Mycobacteroides abscessus TaxID=36809 RepID=UPI002102A167|nr:hypothetical protein [Mycobacteroides abscessus]
MSMVYAVSNRTDGVVEPEDLATIPKFAAGAAQAFVDNGLWSPLDKGWEIIDFKATQSSRETLEAAEQARIHNRVADRERKARQRAEARARAAARAAEAESQPDSPQDVPPDFRVEVRPESRPDTQARPVARRGKDKGDHQSALPMAAGDEWRGPGDNPFTEYK